MAVRIEHPQVCQSTYGVSRSSAILSCGTSLGGEQLLKLSDTKLCCKCSNRCTVVILSKEFVENQESPKFGSPSECCNHKGIVAKRELWLKWRATTYFQIHASKETSISIRVGNSLCTEA